LKSKLGKLHATILQANNCNVLKGPLGKSESNQARYAVVYCTLCGSAGEGPVCAQKVTGRFVINEIGARIIE